jgi:PBSX family phage portal protein
MASKVVDSSDTLGREIDDAFRDTYGRVIVGKTVETILSQPDPFSQDAEVFKTMDGLSATSKKRAYRAFTKVHEGDGGAKSNKREPGEGFVTGYQLLDVVLPPHNLDYLAKLYTLSAPHFAAVNVKVANIVGLGYDFMDSHATQDALEGLAEGPKAKKTKKIREARGAMYEWLESCNKEDDFLETLKKIYIDYETTGNGYMEIGRKNTGEVGYIGHIPATTMRVRRKRDGFVQIIGNKAEFFKHFGTDTRDPIGENAGKVNEVIHFKKYDPTNSYYGIPDILAASQAVAGNEFAARFNLDYFENKAVPRYVVVVKGGNLGTSSQKEIVEFFETGLRGKNHRTLFVPLPPDSQDEKVSFEMKPIEAGTQDASFGNYHKINLASIFMAHRTPAGKSGYAGDGQSLAAARDADKTFKEGVCRPEQKIFERKFGKVVKEKTDMFNFKLTELTLTDEDTQSQIDERDVRMQIVTPNEVRTRRGMPGRKGGDEVVDLKAQDKAEQTAQATGSRTRDANRSAGATDSKGEGRSAKGDGRTTS